MSSTRYVVPSSGWVLDLSAADCNTALGAACFLPSALETLHTVEASKMSHLRRLKELEHDLAGGVRRVT